MFLVSLINSVINGQQNRLLCLYNPYRLVRNSVYISENSGTIWIMYDVYGFLTNYTW